MADVLPGIYHRFLPDFFQTVIPGEASATCSDCVMLPDAAHKYEDSVSTYSPASKCCTYYPEIPNYLVGAILAENDPAYEEAKSRLREKIRERIALSPHGLDRPKKYTLLVKNTSDYFGKSQLLICPFYSRKKGFCTLWPYLTATCRTWFCKYDRGQEGLEFWRALRIYWEHLQEILIQKVLHASGFAPEIILRPPRHSLSLTLEDLDDRPPTPARYEQLWGTWSGREEDFFRKAHALVAELSPDAFNSLAGINHAVHLAQVIKSFEAMMKTDPPRRLKRNPSLYVKKTGVETFFVKGYSPRDVVEMSGRLYEMLDHFDGRRPVDEVIESLIEQKKLVPDPDLLLSLYHMRILIPADRQ